MAIHYRNAHRGFTLIEVLIAVAIIGIVAAIAVPSYSKYTNNARRTDAISFLSEIAGEQVRFFSNNNQYAQTMGELGYGPAGQNNFATPEGHYQVAITNPGGTGRFLITATPVVGGRQAADTECLAFTLSDTGLKNNTGSRDDCW